MLTPLFNKAYLQAVTARLDGTQPCIPVPPGGRAEKIFNQAMFTIMGRLAKLDGLVTQCEIDFATTVMTQLGLDYQARRTAIAYFEAGKARDCDVAPLVQLLARNIGAGSELASLFLQTQCRATLAKGETRLREKMLLRDIAEGLGFTKADLHIMSADIRVELPAHAETRSFLHRAYKTLDLSPSADNIEIRRAYLRLMSRYHPDKLMTSNLSEDAQQLALSKAQEKSMAIREAYEFLCGYRKMRA